MDIMCPFGVMGPGTICKDGIPSRIGDGYNNTTLICRAWVPEQHGGYGGSVIIKACCKRLYQNGG